MALFPEIYLMLKIIQCLSVLFAVCLSLMRFFFERAFTRRLFLQINIIYAASISCIGYRYYIITFV